MFAGLARLGEKAGMKKRITEVRIRGEQFLINGEPTYKNRTWNGHKIAGLLMNSRMVQGIFDDLNPETRGMWTYSDTGAWDADRNPMPILFNEDDHFHFDRPMNNLVAAISEYAGWGFFDYRMKGEVDFNEGYQSVPVNWGLSSERKRAFFKLLKEVTGA
jgi:hypothetical protein